MKCNVCTRTFGSQAALAQHKAARCGNGGARTPQPAPQVPRPRPRRQNKIVANRPRGIPLYSTRVRGNDSELDIVGEELAYVLTQQDGVNTLSTTNRSNFWPGSSGMTRLDQYGRMFEQYRVKSITYKYRTSSGTVTNGATLMAFDYEASDFPIVLGALQVHQPRIRTPVWENGELRIDPSRANKSKWMFTAGGITRDTPGFTSAGIVVSSAPAATALTEYGDIWCKYHVTFTGPTTSNAAVAMFATSDAVAGAQGLWSTTPGSNYNGSFVVTGHGTPNLDVKPLSMGEYLFQFVQNEWTTDVTRDVGTALVTAINAAGNTATLLTNPVDLEGVIQLLINVQNYPATHVILPAILGGLHYAVTGYRMPGGSQRT